jgi:hypothetical protein
MSRYVSSDTTSAVDIQARAVVSRMTSATTALRSTVFGFDAGAGLSEQQASRVHRRRRETRCGTGVLAPHRAGNAAQSQRARTDGHAPYARRCGVKLVVCGWRERAVAAVQFRSGRA